MPDKQIGRTFTAELAAAGLAGLPFSWTDDGVLEFGETITAGQRAAVTAIRDAHDADAPDLAGLRAAKAAAIDAATAAAVDQGVAYADKVIQIDAASRQNIAAIATRAIGVVQEVTGLKWPDGFAWRCLDNSWLPIGPIDFLAMAQLAADRYTAIVVNRAALRDALAAAGTVPAIAAIDPAAGWPA